jgi:hypothetical protein
VITFVTSRLLDGSLSGAGEPEESSRGNTDDGLSHQESRPI